MALILNTSKPRKNRRRSAGFTLVEVMISMGVFTMSMLSFFNLCMSTVQMNRKTSQSIAALNVITDRYNEIIGAATNPSTVSAVGDSPAKALLVAMQDKHDFLKTAPSGFPYSVTLNATKHVLVYEFMVPSPGYRNYQLDEDEDDIEKYRDQFARGALLIYLKERAVPQRFVDWQNVTSGGVSAGASFFRMRENPDDASLAGDGDFTGLFDAGFAAVTSSDLESLPVSIVVRHYLSKEAMESDDLTDVDLGIDHPGAASMSVVRDYIINMNCPALDA